MEEFFLGLLGVGDELHVVHDKYVVLAVLILEIVRISCAHGVDVINCEFLACYVQHFFTRMTLFEVIPYRLYEVCFTVPRRSIDE